ncbi:MAG: ABC transporter permease [Anaerolineae bacterium]|nr:ABC transporter permease [Anaerolineae bacterium]
MSTTPSDAPTRRETQPWLAQWWDLFLMELTNWRWSWRSALLMGVVTPLFSLLGLGIFARDSGVEALAYVMTGNVVVSLLFGAMNSVQGRVLWMRFQGGLDFIATLPVKRSIFILAMVSAFFLLNLPSILITMLLGPLLLKVPVAPHPLLILVIPFCVAPLAGVGAILGLTGRTQQESGNLTFLLTLLMTGLGPVIVPPDRLPGFMLALGRLSPATYAASALRQTLVGPVTPQLIVDLGVLAALAVLSLAWVGRRMNLRED